MRTTIFLVAISAVLSATGCGSIHTAGSAQENHRLLQSDEARHLSEHERDLLREAVAESDAAGTSLAGKSIRFIVAMENDAAIRRTNDRLIAESARYNEAVRAASGRDEESLDADTHREPLLTGTFSTAARSL